MLWVEVWHSVLLEASGPCWHCGGPTNTVEPNFETWLHLGYCTMAKDREYWAAVLVDLSGRET